MARKRRTQTHHLTALDALQQQPQQYALFDLLRALERQLTEYQRLGRSKRPSQDPVRLHQTPSLAFAAADIEAFKWDEQGRAHLYNLAYGVLGVNGPMPRHITEYAIQRRVHQGDSVLPEFLDIFHHRLISLLYRAWANSQLVVELDRPDVNAFDGYVSALAGRYHDDSQPLSRYAALSVFRAGLMRLETRPAQGLVALVSDTLQLPCWVEQFSGAWLELAPQQQCCLGDVSGNGLLGQTVWLGSRVYDYQYRFTLHLGPMTHNDLQRLLPAEPVHRHLQALVRDYVGLQFDWSICCQVRADTVPQWQLGQQGWLGRGVCLGDCQQLPSPVVAVSLSSQAG